MTMEILLDSVPISAEHFEQEEIDELLLLSFVFNVTSEQYHDITTLLYRNVFNVEVRDRGLKFRGEIQQYSTTFTNLYEKGNTGKFHLKLLEVKEG